jgi:hypothetical protein
LEVQKSLKRGE